MKNLRAAKEANFKMTIYLTAANKRRIDCFSEEIVTDILNEAIADIFEDGAQGNLKQELLEELENSNAVPSNGVPTQDAIREIRDKEISNLMYST